MEKRIKYTDEDLGAVRVVQHFLPSPAQLAQQDEKVKITLSLSRASLDFFKTQAEKLHMAYQRMVRNLLDAYALQHMKQS